MQGYFFERGIMGFVCVCLHVSSVYLHCIFVSRFECVIQSVPSPPLVQCGVGIFREEKMC